MRSESSRILAACLLGIMVFGSPAGASGAAGNPPSPSEFLGFELGADRQLADYKQITAYFRTLAAASPRIEIQNLGPTTLGQEMIQAVISSEQNLRDKRRYQELARKLADPRGLSETELQRLVQDGKVILLISCNIHASEIGATQMAMEWAYSLATANDAETKRRLDNVILLLVPSLNPDGQIMEVEWYRKNLGTPYEGGRMPWLYHHYVGHDNNRDWYMLTQKESRAMNRAVYFEWFPQVWLDEHQMGPAGPRMFVPPYTSPVAQRLDPLLWRVVDHMGTLMSWRLEEQQKSGVIYGYVFDAYWPGGTKNTAWWKNIIGLLTEVASTRMGTPVEIAPGELSGGGKGLVEYRQQTNFPNPWPGGKWRLRDIMDYERIASDAILEACATHREDVLRAKLHMVRGSIKSAEAGQYYAVPLLQRDPMAAARLAHLLAENGVEVKFSAAEETYFIAASQPMARFITEMLEVQRYPRVRLTSSSPYLAPYDVTAWTLPLMMGVQVSKRRLSPEQEGALRALQKEDWPKGGLTQARAVLYAVSPESNQTSLLINELLKRKIDVRLARQAFRAGDREFAAGTLLIEPHEELGNLAETCRIALHGLAEKPRTPADRLNDVRSALYKPWLASMDEGWTRWVLEQYRFNFVNVDNKSIKEGNLSGEFSAVLLPDISKEIITEGKVKREEGAMRYSPEFPPEYAGGIGKEGVANLKKFVEQGGTLVTLASACEFAISEFELPVANVLGRAGASSFNCPGAILRVNVEAGHPVTYGMPSEAAAFLTDAVAFRTVLPGAEMTRKVLVTYPDQEEDILLSGWMLGADQLERRAAVVALTYGKGKIVLLGFRVQHRAQTEGTFKLLFNALHWAGLQERSN